MSEEIRNHYFNKTTLIGIFVVLVLLLVGWKLEVFGNSAGTYQAVFLTNNQVYFGKLSERKSPYPTLHDIYYLQITQTLQPRDPSAPSQQLQLVKLGNELHGPQDEMKINKDHILFIEDLKPDSQVVRAIEAFKKNQ